VCKPVRLEGVLTKVVCVEQDALMSPNPRGKIEDLVVGCVCCLVV